MSAKKGMIRTPVKEKDPPTPGGGSVTQVQNGGSRNSASQNPFFQLPSTSAQAAPASATTGETHQSVSTPTTPRQEDQRSKVQTTLNSFITSSKRKSSPSAKLAGSIAKKSNMEPIALNNRYSALVNHKDSSSAETANSTIEPNGNAEREPKPAPMYVRNVKTETVIAMVKSATGNDNVRCLNIRRGDVTEVKVQCANIDDYRKTVTAFDDSALQYYTYRLKIFRGLCVVIKGIEIGVDTEEIKMELEKQGFLVSTVTNIINREKKPQPLYKVELEPSTTKLKPGQVHPIYNLRYLLNRVVTVEEPRKRAGPVQCTNCQEYSHTRGYCTLLPICVICGEQHATADCDKPKDDTNSRKCKNCLGNHTANYRGCAVFVALRKQSQKFTRPNQPKQNPPRQQPPVQLPSTSVLQNTSYRDALVNPQPLPTTAHQPNVHNGNSMEQMFQTMINMMMQFMTTFQSSIQEMMRTQTQIIQQLQCSR